ncbi:MAG: ATP-grasp domain-containing protein [Vicinamibacterales bacterium]|nr:ATP-grasp domain-containing protein [Vicinamibacterales bacterium]
MSLFPGMTVVCLASYFKGVDFLRQCHAHGCRVILVVKEKLREDAWPHDALEQFITVPNGATAEVFLDTVTALARARRLDRVVALEEYDVMHAAMIREHLRIPGMGTTTARLFRDKLAMRVKAHDAGVRVPDFVHVLNEDEMRGYMRAVPPPWVLKPRMDVSAIGIQKIHEPDLVWRAVEALDARPALNERSSYYLLERFVPGAVYHVDSLVQNGEVVFAGVNRYWRPPMEVAHKGGVFVTCTVEHGSHDERALLSMNAALLKAMNFVRGATHAEFIKGEADGEFYFLEVAARVGGAYIAETLEAATGVNVWREWANIELARDVAPYHLPPHVNDYAGVALALARQEWPDTSAFDDPEIVHRVHKRYHVGLIVRSPSYARVQQLLGDHVERITREHLAVLPPLERAE